MASPALAVRNARLHYGSGSARTIALDAVSISVQPGELVLVSGPSGSGKTSLLLIASTLLQPDVGQVEVVGREATHLGQAERAALRLRHIGFVFQSFRLFKGLSALENVVMAGQLAGLRLQQATQQARELLARLGLAHREHSNVATLSGGEKQRVAIARSLVTSPDVILADEPTASLDSRSGTMISALLQSLVRDLQLAAIVVSHDPRMDTFADRVVRMRDGCVLSENSCHET